MPICPECQAEVQPGRRFCKTCGHALPSGNEYPGRLPSRKRSIAALVLSIASLVMGVIAIISTILLLIILHKINSGIHINHWGALKPLQEKAWLCIYITSILLPAALCAGISLIIDIVRKNKKVISIALLSTWMTLIIIYIVIIGLSTGPSMAPFIYLLF